MRRLSALLLITILIFSLTGCHENSVKGIIVNQASHTMAELDIMPQKLFEFAQIGDTVTVASGDFKAQMPLVDELIPESGKLQLLYDENTHGLMICVYDQNFFEAYDISLGASVIISKS